MARLLEAVRNSPLVKRRTGGYNLVETENKDPFVHGLNFHAQFVGSCKVEQNQNTPQVQQAVKDTWVDAEATENSKPMRKVIFTVKANYLQVKDARTKEICDYPIYLVSYCGTCLGADILFFFIHKNKETKVLMAEIFKLAEPAKVTSVTLACAKAFNIAYKAYMAEKRRRERADFRGSESPLVPRKHMGSVAKAKDVTKLVNAAALATYTPPAPRKQTSPEAESGHHRSSSFDETSPKKLPAQNPAVSRVRTEDAVTGSSHDITVTDDFYSEFKNLAERHDRGAEEDTDGCARPEEAPAATTTSTGGRPFIRLSTHLPPSTQDAFNLESIKKHVDEGSMEDLTKSE